MSASPSYSKVMGERVKRSDLAGAATHLVFTRDNLSITPEELDRMVELCVLLLLYYRPLEHG